MKQSLIILAFFALGTILGLYRYLPQFIMENDLSLYALYLLMFLVGVGIGSDKSSLSVIKRVKFKILMVPFSIIVGTLLGVAGVTMFIPSIDLKSAFAVGAGFGYYSLSSILISEISGDSLGVIALLSNIIREVFTLLTAPLLIKYFGKLAGIAAGGATSMDTTLPIITMYSGKEYAVISIFSGMVLTVLVPFLVTFILTV